jgi:hypothetical protein
MSISQPQARRTGEENPTMRYIIQLWSDERPAAPAHVAAMTRYYEDLARAGVLLATEGFLPSSKGARISMAGGEPQVERGPFPGPGKQAAGFWTIRARSREEAIDWARRCPLAEGDVLEVRQAYGAADFHAELSLLHAGHGYGYACSEEQAGTGK